MDYDIQENHEFEVVYKDGKMVMPDVEDYEAYDSAGNVTASADVEGKAASPRKKSVSSRGVECECFWDAHVHACLG